MPRVPFVEQINTRGVNDLTQFATYDSLYQNVIFVPVNNELTKEIEVNVEKRPGFSSSTTYSNLTTVSETYNWKGGSSGSDVELLSGLASSVPKVLRSTSVIKDHGSGTVARYFSNTFTSAGTAMAMWARPAESTPELWYYADAGTATQITIPTGMVGRQAQMDGYTFIGKGTPARIYNSALNDPTTGYTNYISANSETDSLVSVIKNGRFILGAGKASIDWFYNQGNASGSPLSRLNDQSLLETFGKIGLNNADSFCEGLGSIWFLSTIATSGKMLHRISGTSLKKIKNAAVEKILTQYTGTISMTYIEWAGIPMVMIGLDTHSTPGTLVYFPDVDLWSWWVTGLASGIQFTLLFNALGTNPLTFGGNVSLLWDAASPVYLDVGNSITRVLRTKQMEFGTPNRKRERRLTVIGDKQTSAYAISESHSDDGYANYSTAVDIDMASDRPWRRRGGSFFSRAYKFSDTAQGPGRMRAFEVDLEGGAT